MYDIIYGRAPPKKISILNTKRQQPSLKIHFKAIFDKTSAEHVTRAAKSANQLTPGKRGARERQNKQVQIIVLKMNMTVYKQFKQKKETFKTAFFC
jgi:hypothetical protein